MQVEEKVLQFYVSCYLLGPKHSKADNQDKELPVMGVTPIGVPKEEVMEDTQIIISQDIKEINRNSVFMVAIEGENINPLDFLIATDLLPIPNKCYCGKS